MALTKHRIEDKFGLILEDQNVEKKRRRGKERRRGRGREEEEKRRGKEGQKSMELWIFGMELLNLSMDLWFI